MTHFIDALESRRLLAATLDGLVLTVRGDAGDSTIAVARAGRHVAVTINGATQRFTIGSFARIDVIAYSGNDSIDLSGAAVQTHIVGGAGNDVLFGSLRNDVIEGGAGNDALYGLAGDDRLDGGEGSDLLSGGDGRDTVDYSARTRNLTLSIARGNYDDGEPGERDNIRSDIEGIIGGAGDDDITGWLSSDFLSGGDGDDTIIGDRGYDTINGDDGDDSLSGDDGNDQIRGGDGDDFIDGGDDSNRLYGGAGSDYFWARNDKTDDGIDGGPGFDIAKTDFRFGGEDGVDQDNTTHVEDVDRRVI